MEPFDAHVSYVDMARIFGHIKGQPAGTKYVNRRALHDAGVHAPLQAGISGTGKDGADSIVVSGGYVDDKDYGDTIVYTGHGGRDADTRRQVSDQELSDPGNAGLVRSELEGLPVRVVRGRNPDSPHAPASGLRYDGLFRVESHGAKVGIDGFRIWQFTLVKLPDEASTTATPPPLQSTLDGVTNTPGPAPVIETVVQRIVRSTKVVQQVKAWYDHECQICGLAVEVAGGRYSEGAHIQAIGSPHYGPDIVENILCLCPNDHVRFDNGAIYLSDDLKVIEARTAQVKGTLIVNRSHRINPQYVANHRARWTTGTARG
ncbi:YDG/SRA domain-containing protein [Nonomuraea aurantiaca]|uniref:YDG/SRA domain-containing protein n=1 Tax=Nonomuraea aurantiaca TaxID=2878562 RepID=UPI001CD94273|nr:YDG/SRA domain-containing protein [Nonomuraea aurantiaca]MCA2227738.1 HNH endonuclease [Nonomuraea aurantiaca]